MEQKIIFRQLLGELVRIADENGNRLTTQQVDEYLSHAALTKEQLEMVYAYLTEQRIHVTGFEREPSRQHVPGQNPAEQDSADRDLQRGEDGTEQETLRLYLEELEKIEALPPELELLLFRSASKGDRDAKNRLAEAYLNVVCDLAGELEKEGMPVEDLIQEGNMGLLMALENLEEEESLAAFQARLINRINEHMQFALRSFQDVLDQDQGMTRKVSRLEEAIRKLEDELGRKVSLEELSAYLEMTVEELEGILKLT